MGREGTSHANAYAEVGLRMRHLPGFIASRLDRLDLQVDKLQHFIGGGAIGGTVTIIVKLLGFGYPELWGISAATLVGAAKEALDQRTEGNHWDGEDLLATVVGGIVISYFVCW